WSFFVDPPRAAARAAAHLARDSGATLSFDPASFQMIEEMGVSQFLACTQDLGIDVFLPNYQEGEVLTGLDEPDAIAAALAKLYPQALIMLKLDADGALVYENGVATAVPPATNNLVDATGAGDSFAGAFLARYLSGSTALEAAHFATNISAWVIEQLGARPKPDAHLRAILRRPNSASSTGTEAGNL
ncbi:MAG: carbohydrate kinase family protein, partial [Ilumatobacteraceae bacterium]